MKFLDFKRINASVSWQKQKQTTNSKQRIIIRLTTAKLAQYQERKEKKATRCHMDLKIKNSQQVAPGKLKNQIENSS